MIITLTAEQLGKIAEEYIKKRYNVTETKATWRWLNSTDTDYAELGCITYKCFCTPNAPIEPPQATPVPKDENRKIDPDL